MKKINKTTNIIFRVSEQDKQKVKALAENNQMTVSELLVYMIRREYDKERKSYNV